MQSIEIWKDIPNYEGLYQASNLGRVKSIKRVVCRSNGCLHTIKEKILKENINGAGYFIVNLYKNRKMKTFAIHKLIATAFLNHTPCGHKEVIDHVNNDKLNNRVDNLQLTTARHNSSKDRKGKSKYTGVCWDKNSKKWMARIRLNGKQNYLGLFANEIDAHNAYQNKLKEINDSN
jgi:hypothetical protein